MVQFDSEHISALIIRAQRGDEAAKAQLISEHMGLVYQIAARFYGRGADKEDLHQLGALGLLFAIQKFDCTKGTRFSTYAVPVITGELKRYFRDHGAMKVSRSLKTLANHAARAREQYQAEHGRSPTICELADLLHISGEELIQAIESTAPIRSFSEPFGDDNLTLAETIPTPDSTPQLLERLDIASAVQSLSEREQAILYFRFSGEKSQSYIAKKLGISQVQVSRLEKKILLALKKQLK